LRDIEAVCLTVMKAIKAATEKYKRTGVQKKRAAPHPLAACADEIEKAKLFTLTYGRGYWLRQLSLYCRRHNIEREAMFTELIGMLKGIHDMDAKYSKGGRLTNLLKA
jgi:hypothetical protein